MKDYKTPEFVKLGTGGDIYSWLVQMQTHFESKGTWNFINENEELQLPEDSDLDEDRVTALCRRDLMASVHQDIKSVIRSQNNPHLMFLRIKRLFVGSILSQKRKLKNFINNLEFAGNYFFFMTKYENYVTQLIQLPNGVRSYKELTSDFLDKFPKSMNSVIYPYKERVEDDEEEDNEDFWFDVFEKIMDYLIEGGYYDASKRQYDGNKKTSIYKAKGYEKSKRKETRKCYKCGKKGHLIRNCPNWKKGKKQDREETKEEINDDSSKESESWMCQSESKDNKEKRKSYFLLDSGATDHVCGDKSLFVDLKKITYTHKILTANGTIEATHVGTVKLKLDNGLNVTLKDVLYWVEAPLLLSVSALVRKRIHVLFKPKNAILMKEGIEEQYQAELSENNSYIVNFVRKKSVIMKATKLVWHARLNHCGEQKLKKSLSKEFCNNINESISKESCVGCMLGKMHRNNIKKKTPTKRRVLELLAADVMGPYDISVDNKRYILNVIDAGSSFIWCFPFKRKIEVTPIIIQLLKQLERKFPQQIKILRTDNGTEFKNRHLQSFLNEKGIEQQYIIPYEHEQNGRIEGANKILLEATRSLLYYSGLSRGYWSFAFKFATFNNNCMIPSQQSLSPWQLLYDETPPLHKLRVFGITGYAHIARETRRKLDPTSQSVLLLGYSEDTEGYIVMDVATSRLFPSRTFHCDETKFVSARSSGALGEKEKNEKNKAHDFTLLTDLTNLEEEELSNREEFPTIIPTDTPTITPTIIHNTDKDESLINNNTEEKLNKEEEKLLENDLSSIDETLNSQEVIEDNILEEPILNIPSEEENKDETLPRYNLRPTIKKPERFHDVEFPILRKTKQVLLLQRIQDLTTKYYNILLAKVEEKGYKNFKEAVRSNPKWRDKYFEEIKKLEDVAELKIVKRTKSMKPIPFIEILTEKKDNILKTIKLKVRLAIRGDLQHDPPTNLESYSSTANIQEIRINIVAINTKDCLKYQGDCPHAYLNGRLRDALYLFLPDGHQLKTKNNYWVYKCMASVYGLKISGRVWYDKFKEEVKQFGLEPLIRCNTMFLKKTSKGNIYLQLYVDDFILAADSKELLQQSIDFLEGIFNVKGTKNIKKFVGIQFKKKEGRLYLHQKDMIEDLGRKYHLEKSNIDYPIIENLNWNPNSTKLENLKPLQKLLGELTYITTVSRPDISYSVNRIARVASQGTKETYRVAKKILQYLLNTKDYMIEINSFKKDKWELKVQSDASFADIKEDKYKSTAGYLIWLNNTLVTWKTKKLKWICTSTAESEYLACYYAAREAIGIGRLIEDFHQRNVFPIEIKVDNKAVIHIVTNSANNGTTRHFATKYYALQGWAKKNLIKLVYVASKDNIADQMTKFTRASFYWFRASVLKQWGSKVNKVNILTKNLDDDESKGEDGHQYVSVVEDRQLRERVQNIVEPKESINKEYEGNIKRSKK